ncbi:Crp/Fnr family transcriptional regulator [Gorillibacterium timonense]|uniref:Crp/Fnr family transcriptional regulator n=1 Tax=Gorillibacterium timonense TaxID=1689269 RepID=UPI00071DB550|nr:Crp/Fnr family transcriptional regulator [Gorillibacterium timonense]
MSDLVAALSRVPLFRELNQEELERIERISSIRHYGKKTTVFHEGTEREAVYFVLRGLVKTFKTDENGHEQIITILKTGDLFPHTGFFDAAPYPATAETIGDSRLLSIPMRPFEQLILTVPSISIKLMRVMSSRIIELQQRLHDFTGHDAAERVVLFLMKLAEDYGRVDDQAAVRIAIPLTNQELANAVGTTRETVNRLVSLLRKEGLLIADRTGFTIPNRDKLFRRVSKDEH